jgi:hypothetical protein
MAAYSKVMDSPQVDENNTAGGSADRVITHGDSSTIGKLLCSSMIPESAWWSKNIS